MLPSPQGERATGRSDAEPSEGSAPTPLFPGLRFLARLTLRFETPLSAGETAEGICFQLPSQGAISGPNLTGSWQPSTISLRVDADGVGLLEARGVLFSTDAARIEIEATGRCDFGADGYRRACGGDLASAPTGGTFRFLTGHPRWLWLNRAQCLGIGELDATTSCLLLNLFAVTVPS